MKMKAVGGLMFHGLPLVLCLATILMIIAIGALACASSTVGTVSSSSLAEPRAAIIDQLYSLQPNDLFISDVTQKLEAYGFSVDLYQGDEVTVDFYKQLPGYGYSLIIFRAHSGILGSGDEIIKRTCLFTNEPYSETKHVTEQLTDQLAKARIDEHHPWVFGIGDEFVTRSIERQFDSTVIIMMGCATLYFDDMAQAFIQKGASTYLGWDAAVSLGYVEQATLILITNLCAEQMTIKKAVVETMALVGPDPNYGAYLQYYPSESGNQTIKALNR